MLCCCVHHWFFLTVHSMQFSYVGTSCNTAREDAGVAAHTRVMGGLSRQWHQCAHYTSKLLQNTSKTHTLFCMPTSTTYRTHLHAVPYERLVAKPNGVAPCWRWPKQQTTAQQLQQQGREEESPHGRQFHRSWSLFMRVVGQFTRTMD